MAASTTRPSNGSPTGMSAPLARGHTGQPSPTPATSPNGISNARSFEKPTTSAFSDLPCARRIVHAVPTATEGSVASTMMPETRVTFPASGRGSASASAAARCPSNTGLAGGRYTSVGAGVTVSVTYPRRLSR